MHLLFIGEHVAPLAPHCTCPLTEDASLFPIRVTITFITAMTCVRRPCFGHCRLSYLCNTADIAGKPGTTHVSGMVPYPLSAQTASHETRPHSHDWLTIFAWGGEWGGGTQVGRTPPWGCSYTIRAHRMEATATSPSVVRYDELRPQGQAVVVHPQGAGPAVHPQGPQRDVPSHEQGGRPTGLRPGEGGARLGRGPGLAVHLYLPQPPLRHLWVSRGSVPPGGGGSQIFPEKEQSSRQ